MNTFEFRLQRFSTYYNYNRNSLVSGSAYADTIRNYAGGVTISGGKGNDSICSSTNSSYTIKSSYGYVTIDGGAGNDTINSNDPNVSINGAGGNDSIYTGNWRNMTIKGGEGNDTIKSSNNYGVLYQYAFGDGNDIIYGFNNKDTISISTLSGERYTRSTVGSDVVVSVGSVSKNTFKANGAITLSGANGKTINISGSPYDINVGKSAGNYSKNSLVSGSDYDDTIKNCAGGTTISGGKGNDSIYTSTSSSYTIKNGYGYVTIDGGDGNDSITSYDPYASINGANGDDNICTGNWRNVTIKGGKGNDTIQSNSSYGVLYQYIKGDGNDVIYGYNSKDTISITDGTWKTLISGNDAFVSVSGSGVITLVGASGKTINVVSIQSVGKLMNNSVSNTLLNGTNYADTISNYYASNVTINAGAANDYIYNCADKVTIAGGKGNDSVTGEYSNSEINADAGNDLISLTGSYWRNSIDGASGNDTIIAGGDQHSVNGGAGDDRISLSGDKLTVKGGLGNDSIYGNTATSHLYQYSNADGFDVIYNWSNNDTLSITDGYYTRSTVGNNVVIAVGSVINDTFNSNGAITLSGASGRNIFVDGLSYDSIVGNSIENSNRNSLVSGSAYADTIKNRAGGVTICAGEGDDSIYNNTKSTYLINNSYGYVTIDGGNGNDSICSHDPNVSINGGAGNDKISVSSSSSYKAIILEGGLGDDTLYGNSLGAGVVYQYTVGDGNDLIFGFKDSDTISISGGAYCSTLTVGNNFLLKITDTTAHTSTITLNNASRKTINVYPQTAIITQQSVTEMFIRSLESTTQSGISALNQAVRFATNGYFKNLNSAITAMKNDCFSYGWENFLKEKCAIDPNNLYAGVITVSDEPVVNYCNDLPQFIKEGLTGLAHGIDTEQGKIIESLAKNTTKLVNSLSLTATALDENTAYAGGYIFLCYLAKQGSENYGTVSISDNTSGTVVQSSANSADKNVSLKGKVLTVSKNFDGKILDLADYSSSANKVNAAALSSGIMLFGNSNATSISLGAGNDTVFANSGNDKLYGGDGNDILYGDAGNDSISGNAGNDSICGGSGNDTLTGGGGADLFIYSDGKDVITDYAAGDKISLGAAVKNASLSGSDAVLIIGSGKLTVKNRKELTLIDSNGNELNTIIGSSIFSDDSTAKVTLGSGIEVGDASSRTAAIKIVGNALNNSIFGGSGKDTLYGKDGNDFIEGGAGSDKLYGENGNDTLWGGLGNDTLTGGAGADLFIYNSGEGKDVITDFSNDDLLQITGTFSATYNSSKNTIAFKVASTSNAITLKNFTATSFNINGDTYRINSKNKLVKNSV